VPVIHGVLHGNRRRKPGCVACHPRSNRGVRGGPDGHAHGANCSRHAPTPGLDLIPNHFFQLRGPPSSLYSPPYGLQSATRRP